MNYRPSHSRDHENSASSDLNSQYSSLSNRSAGFQPYRSAFEESIRSNSASLTGSSIPSHLLPYADSLNYPYHSFLPPPLSNPSGMQHVTPANTTYRYHSLYLIN